MFPNLFSITRLAHPASFLGARYSWPVIGDVLEPRQYLNLSESQVGASRKSLYSLWILTLDPSSTIKMSDESVTEGCIKDIQSIGARKMARLAAGSPEAIAGEHLAVLLCYMVKVDEIGHVFGFSPDYGEAIIETDQLLGRLLDALETSGLASTTMIVLVSDHGRHPETGHEHGAFTSEEIETHWSIAGPGIRRGPLRTPVHTYDTAATVIGALGIEPPLQWHGRMVLEAWEGNVVGDRPLIGAQAVGGKRAGWLYEEPMDPDRTCMEEMALHAEAKATQDSESSDGSILPDISSPRRSKSRNLATWMEHASAVILIPGTARPTIRTHCICNEATSRQRT